MLLKTRLRYVLLSLNYFNIFRGFSPSIFIAEYAEITKQNAQNVHRYRIQELEFLAYFISFKSM